jgi:hypothetical protein
MEDIKVNSSIDLKTYFNISLLISFKLRTILIMIVFSALISYFLISDSSFQLWMKLIISLLIFVVYGGLIMLLIYITCRRNFKRSPVLNETLMFTLNADKIELKGDSINVTQTWKYIIKLIEREKYFLLMPTAKSFHFLPKAGFESAEEITRFKNLIKEKGIKTMYH